MTIDKTTNQVLRLHLETTAVNSKSNNPLFRFKDATTIFECVYQPTATGTTCLDYVKIDYRVLLTRPFKGDLHTQVSNPSLTLAFQSPLARCGHRLRGSVG